jgi:hypothetical protein
MKPEKGGDKNREHQACYGTMFHDTLHFMAKLTLEAAVAADWVASANATIAAG